MLYALSVGVGATDPLVPEALKFTFELGSEGLSVLPSFGVLFGFGVMADVMHVRLAQ